MSNIFQFRARPQYARLFSRMNMDPRTSNIWKTGFPASERRYIEKTASTLPPSNGLGRACLSVEKFLQERMEK